MSIILKGIDMPKDKDRIYLLIEGDKCFNALDPVQTLAEVIPIPTPHGRLIDGDELCNDFSNRCPGDCGCCGESDDIYDCGLIINAPTILEAEE